MKVNGMIAQIGDLILVTIKPSDQYCSIWFMLPNNKVKYFPIISKKRNKFEILNAPIEIYNMPNHTYKLIPKKQ